MSQISFQFQAKVEKCDFGKYYYTVVFLDPAVIPKLPLDDYPRLRVLTEVDGIPVEGAFMPDRDRWYLMTPRKLLKSIGKNLGDEVFVDFIIANQNAVNIPAELEMALKQGPEILSRWNKLTPGKQRGLAYSLSKIKTLEIRERKLLEILDNL